MKWITDLDEALVARESEQKRLLLILKGNGNWCPWCNKLDEILKESPALDNYLEKEGILAAKIGIPPKSEDTEGIRQRFGVTGIPFIIFYAADGTREGDTEFIDDADAQGYVDWIESVDSSLL